MTFLVLPLFTVLASMTRSRRGCLQTEENTQLVPSTLQARDVEVGLCFSRKGTPEHQIYDCNWMRANRDEKHPNTKVTQRLCHYIRKRTIWLSRLHKLYTNSECVGGKKC